MLIYALSLYIGRPQTFLFNNKVYQYAFSLSLILYIVFDLLFIKHTGLLIIILYVFFLAHLIYFYKNYKPINMSKYIYYFLIYFGDKITLEDADKLRKLMNLLSDIDYYMKEYYKYYNTLDLDVQSILYKYIDNIEKDNFNMSYFEKEYINRNNFSHDYISSMIKMHELYKDKYEDTVDITNMMFKLILNNDLYKVYKSNSTFLIEYNNQFEYFNLNNIYIYLPNNIIIKQGDRYFIIQNNKVASINKEIFNKIYHSKISKQLQYFIQMIILI